MKGVGKKERKWSRAAIAAGLVLSVALMGCQTVSNRAAEVGTVVGIWSAIILLYLPVALIAAPPSLIFEGLDSERSGIVQAEFSPDGKAILFAYRDGSRQQLYRVPSSGGSPELLSAEGRFDFDAVWSPDGSRIVFASSARKKKHADLYLMQSDGGGVKQLTDDDALELGPQFSQDGSRIVFSRWQRGKDGKVFERAAIIELALETGEEAELAHGGAFDYAPRYAGDDVLFLRARGFETVKNPEGRTFRGDELLRYQRGSGAAVSLGGPDVLDVETYTALLRPALTIIYEETAYSDKENLWMIEAGADTGAPLTFAPNYAHREDAGDPIEKHEPVGAPDGSALLFTMTAGTKHESSYWNIAPSELHELNLETDEARPLTQLGKAVTRPRYAPDGGQILFLLNEHPARERERHSLWVINRDGTGLRNLDIGSKIGGKD